MGRTEGVLEQLGGPGGPVSSSLVTGQKALHNRPSV